MALSSTGFQRRTYDEIVSDKILKAQELFGADINTEENTPLGKFIRINAYDEALLSEEMEAVYYSIFPNTAQGVSLDRLCTFVGISRNPAMAARYTVVVSGTVDTTVPFGFLVGTESGITFYNTVAATIGSTGTAALTVECTENGLTGNVNPQEITQIINPAANVSGISAVTLDYYGDETESDYSLRKRFETARDGLGSCNEASIVAAIMGVPTVESVGIISNETEETDEDNRPPHSFECFVAGGGNYHQQIAEAIFSRKPIGIRTTGDVACSVSDASGNSYSVSFSHTQNVDVYVKVKIKTTAEYIGDDGSAEIQSNISNYINNLGVGGSALLTAMYGEVYKVVGIKEVPEIQLSTNGSTWVTTNITATIYQKLTCEEVTVEVITS